MKQLNCFFVYLCNSLCEKPMNGIPTVSSYATSAFKMYASFKTFKDLRQHWS